jgi:hypothetical protein
MIDRRMYGGDSSEEEMFVLPKHTKVVVTGNNRISLCFLVYMVLERKLLALAIGIGWYV